MILRFKGGYGQIYEVDCDGEFAEVFVAVVAAAVPVDYRWHESKEIYVVAGAPEDNPCLTNFEVIMPQKAAITQAEYDALTAPAPEPDPLPIIDDPEPRHMSANPDRCDPSRPDEG